MAVTQKELPLNIGQKLSATIRGEKYNITLRGWSVNRYLITDLPSVPGEHFRVAPQTGCLVNYIREGIFVNFKSQVVYGFAQAVSLMIIEYPRNFDLHNLRDGERYKVNFPLSYSAEVNGTEVVARARIRDMSFQGLLFCHSDSLSKDDKIAVSFELPHGKIEKIPAVVRNIRKNPKSGSEPFVTGAKFLNLSKKQYDLLGEFLQTRARERRQGGRS